MLQGLNHFLSPTPLDLKISLVVESYALDVQIETIHVCLLREVFWGLNYLVFTGYHWDLEILYIFALI